MASVSSSAGFTPLHYGGSLSPKTGKLGAKPQQGSYFKKLRRLETMVRLENAGFTPSQMAPILIISISRVKQIMQSPAYLITRIKITHGIILNEDANMPAVREQRREMLAAMVPTAFQVLLNEIMSPASTLAERKHKASIAQDLLDREGTLAKISRAEVKPVDAFDFEKVDAESNKLINVIRSVAPAPAVQNASQFDETVKVNKEFSNSHTLSAVDQQLALVKLEEEASAVGEINLSAEVLKSMLPENDKIN